MLFRSEPEEFMDDGFEVAFFGCNQGKSFVQIKPHLITKDRFGAGASSVGFGCAGFKDFFHQL